MTRGCIADQNVDVTELLDSVLHHLLNMQALGEVRDDCNGPAAECGDFLHYATAIPLGRLVQTADIASLTAFLASPQSDYLTGLSIPVAGVRTDLSRNDCNFPAVEIFLGGQPTIRNEQPLRDNGAARPIGPMQQNLNGFAGPPDPVLPHADPTCFGFATVVLIAFDHWTRSAPLALGGCGQLLAMNLSPLNRLLECLKLHRRLLCL
jgi:hypothetical protein